MRGGYWWLLAVTDGYRRLPAVTGGYRRLLRRSHEERRGGAPIDAVFALGAAGSARTGALARRRLPLRKRIRVMIRVIAEDPSHRGGSESSRMIRVIADDPSHGG